MKRQGQGQMQGSGTNNSEWPMGGKRGVVQIAALPLAARACCGRKL